MAAARFIDVVLEIQEALTGLCQVPDIRGGAFVRATDSTLKGLDQTVILQPMKCFHVLSGSSMLTGMVIKMEPSDLVSKQVSGVPKGREDGEVPVGESGG